MRSFAVIICLVSLSLRQTNCLNPIGSHCLKSECSSSNNNNGRASRLFLSESNERGDNFRVISPNNIGNLFNSPDKSRPPQPQAAASKSQQSNFEDDFSEEEEQYDESIYDLDDGDEEDMEDFLNASNNKVRSSRPDSPAESSSVMQELRAVQSLKFSSSSNANTIPDQPATVSSMNNNNNFNNNNNPPRVVDELDAQYVDLGGELDQTKRSTVLNSITVSESEYDVLAINREQQRVFSYDPSPTAGRDDPMLWGAYRIHQKDAPEREEDGNKKLPKRRPTKGGNGPKKGNKKDDKKSSTDSFYSAIKNLGGGGESGSSGPFRGGPEYGVGLAEPSGDKKPITPRKASANRRKKTIITPSDINNLFDSSAAKARSGQSSNSAVESDVDDTVDYDYDEEDDNQGEDNGFGKGIMGFGFKSSMEQPAGKFNPVIEPGEEIPQWLMDARKEQKKEIQGKRNKKQFKKLTNDWRFWLACIVSVGFVSAFYNVYQQTGGFGSGAGGGGGISGGEMLI